MRLSVEVLDHIFSFLASDRESLIACSEEPVLSPIVARHLYRHVTVRIGGKSSPKLAVCNYTFEPERLSSLVSENRHIANYIRVLKIEPDFAFPRVTYRKTILERLDEFAKTLLMFPLLECVTLGPTGNIWHWSDAFRVALEDRLTLGTIKEVHFVGGKGFPFSLLDNCKHVKKLSLSGSFNAEGRFRDSTLPQLESLSLFTDSIPPSLLAWLKFRVKELQSLKSVIFSASVGVLPDLLGVCSESLKKLEIDLTDAYSDYNDYVTDQSGQIVSDPLVKISPVPLNLQQLTLRTAVYMCRQEHHPNCCLSNLPAAAEIIHQFLSSPQRLTLNIDIDFSTCSNLTLIDFGPLTLLGAASKLSIPRINLYVHARFPVTHAQLMPLLEEYEDIMRPMKAGVLVVHPGKTVSDV